MRLRAQRRELKLSYMPQQAPYTKLHYPTGK